MHLGCRICDLGEAQDDVEGDVVGMGELPQFGIRQDPSQLLIALRQLTRPHLYHPMWRRVESLVTHWVVCWRTME